MEKKKVENNEGKEKKITVSNRVATFNDTEKEGV